MRVDMEQVVKDEASVEMETCSFNTNEQKQQKQHSFGNIQHQVDLFRNLQDTDSHFTKHDADNDSSQRTEELTVNYGLLWC